MDNNNIVVSKNQKLKSAEAHKWHKWGGIYPPKRD
ncbi:unnamed protein product [Brassica rapa subsp. trilocularis]